MFYHMFWDIIKRDLVEMFEELHKGKLDLYILNKLCFNYYNP
jgi:hypothetical protein